MVISPEGELIGRFLLQQKVSNVAFGGDGRLYFTASDSVVRIKIKTKPARILNKKSKK